MTCVIDYPLLSQMKYHTADTDSCVFACQLLDVFILIVFFFDDAIILVCCHDLNHVLNAFTLRAQELIRLQWVAEEGVAR